MSDLVMGSRNSVSRGDSIFSAILFHHRRWWNFRLYYGPINRAFASLDADGQTSLRRELEALWTAHNQSGSDCTTVYGEYLEVIGIRA
ncbi:MAG TPA: hypothetical protein VFU48_00060 [Nitrospira sp.]|nr:hypothetical protein [Nitrospira sp.]